MSSVKPRRRDISAALTKKAVLDAARHLFVTKGFDDTSIDEIARASESSNGAVYHHFRDKQEIFAELFRVSQTAILEATIAAMPPESGGWERVEQATRAFFESYVVDDEARALLAQAINVLGWSRVREFDEGMAIPLIRAMLDEAIQTGEAKPVPAAAASFILFSVYCNAVLFVTTDQEPERAAQEASTVLTALLSGMRVSHSG
ncbi:MULTISPECIES: TetR family transcriptional regulator [unclassified Rhodococcus (in: high G+C Gram-positive bacteria)]|uniref:TetR/AcrR family transcriptional regulator n=1 Tax=Rhodococcus sp. SJ-3 TaxID=3454628 RepID=UPI003F78E696